MTKLIRIQCCVLFGAILYLPVARAQGTDPDKNDSREQPVAPIAAALAAGSTSDSALNSTAEIRSTGDDRRPLSGVQEQDLGANLGVRNFLLPSIHVVSQMATSSSSSGYSRPETLTYLLGTLDLNRVSERSELLLHYTGGAMLSTYLNSAIKIWNFLIPTGGGAGRCGWRSNQLSFGIALWFWWFRRLAFLSGGVSAPFLNPALDPNQTIPTIIAPRLSNTLVSQIEYNFSPRASWTGSALTACSIFWAQATSIARRGLYKQATTTCSARKVRLR